MSRRRTLAAGRFVGGVEAVGLAVAAEALGEAGGAVPAPELRGGTRPPLPGALRLVLPAPAVPTAVTAPSKRHALETETTLSHDSTPKLKVQGQQTKT